MIRTLIQAGHVAPREPGFEGGTGTVREQEFALQCQQALAQILRADGRFHVELCPGDIPDGWVGDLFISLHADSAPGSMVRGASVYTLSERASDKEAEALAKSENQSDIIAGVDLTNEADVVTSILIDLAQRETKNSAVKFAQVLVPELQRAGEVTQKSHRFAGFVVLKAPDVPSVLVEVGYLSNRQDESVMNTNRWRKRMADSIARAVDRYFRTSRGDHKAEAEP